MKKITSLIIAFALMVSYCFVFTGCFSGGGAVDIIEDMVTNDKSEINFTASAQFYYSEDKGSTYRSQRKEFATGETVYMKIIVQILSENETSETIKAVLTIPNITSVESKYYDGQPISCKPNAEKNAIDYEFTIPTSPTNKEWEFTFQFIPSSSAEVSMTLVFDEKIDPSYDKQNTVKFVEE